MSFAWPLVLPLLILPIWLLLGELLVFRERLRERGHSRILRGVAGGSTVALKAREQLAAPPARRRRVLLGMALACAILALARPQWGLIEQPVFEHSREILIGLDLSRSMMAEDVKPKRLERAKLMVQALLEHLKGERIGLVIFSGEAFLQSPLSTDYEILSDVLPSLSPASLSAGGTNYEALLKTALKSYSPSGDADRFLIILSDGEDLENQWRDQLQELKDRGVHVICLGIGTQTGAMVPDGNGGFIKDENGATVLSRLEPGTLQEIARATGGTYREASTWVDLPALLASTVEKGRQGQFMEKRGLRREDRYQWPLGAALLLALISLTVEFPIRVRPRKLHLQGHGAKLLPGLLVCSLLGLASSQLLALTIEKPAAGPAGEKTTSETKPSTLVEDIRQLSAKPELSAADYARIASSTLDWGIPLKQAGQPVSSKVVHDGLAAVREGRALNASAAPWDSFQKKLEELLREDEKSQDQKKQDDQDKKQDKQPNKDNSKQQPKDQQQQQNQSQSQNSSQDQKQDKDKEQQKNEQQKQESSQPQSSEQPKQEPKDASKSSSPAQPHKDQQQPPGKEATPSQETPRNLETKEPEPANPVQASHPEEMQQVGGKEATPAEKNIDPNLVGSIQKLEQLKNNDTPGIVFERLQSLENKPKPETKKNW